MLKHAVVLAAALASTACTQLPRAELQAYRDAFSAAQTAAAPMISDYAVGERAERLENLRDARNFDRTTRPYFPTFDPQVDPNALSTIGLPPGAEAVDRSFRAIAAYNEVLVALAENRNIDVARAQLQQIVTDVSAVAPVSQSAQAVSGAFLGVVESVLRPLIEADNRAEIRRLVQRGHEPMTALVDLLIAHSADQYASTINPLLERLAQPGVDKPPLIARINAWHQVYADYVVLLNAVNDRFDALDLALRNPRSAPLLARASGGAAELRGYADGLRRSIDALRAIL